MEPNRCERSTPRRVTSAEAAHFREHGWVLLREFIDPGLVTDLLSIARSAMGEHGEAPVRSVFPDAVKMWRRYDEPWREHPEFARLGLSPDLGVELATLAGHVDGLRFLSDQLAVKVPLEHGTTDETPWHQDHPYLPIDRTGDLTCWIALHDMTPEHGTMRFLDRSHTEGPLDATLLVEELRTTHAELWDRHPVTDPLTLAAGDATVHDGCLIHCAPPNSAATSRWAYIAEYMPANARATRLPTRHTDKAGILEGQPFDHPEFPRFDPRT